MARCQALGHVLHGRGQARLRRGGARRSPADELQPLARRAPARARAGAVARSVQLPARGQAALEPRRLAVRIRVLAAPGSARDGARVERRSSCSASSARAASRALWLREVGTPRGASLAGGLAFAMAPYLQAQWSAGHLLAWIAMLLPAVAVRARAGEERIGLVARRWPAARSSRSRSRASSISRSERSRSSPRTRSSDCPGPHSWPCPLSAQDCSRTRSP